MRSPVRGGNAYSFVGLLLVREKQTASHFFIRSQHHAGMRPRTQGTLPL